MVAKMRRVYVSEDLAGADFECIVLRNTSQMPCTSITTWLVRLWLLY